MTYPFPEIEPNHIYARTFLRDVSITLQFSIKLSENDANLRFNIFCKEIFHLDNANFSWLKRYGEEGAPKIESSDGMISFIFYIDAIHFKVKYPAYKQFGNIANYFTIAKKYISLLEVKEVSQLRITKFNEIQYNYQSDVVSIEQVMRGIFSKEILEWESFKNPDFTDVARWERKIVFSDSSDNTNALVTYGFSQSDSDMRKGSLTLKISVVSYDISNLSHLDDVLRDCNQIVDRGFYWSASDSILKEMDKND